MANTFKNYTSSSVGTSAETVYTVPSATTSVIIGCTVANTTVNTITVDVQLGSVYIVKGAPIPTGSSLSVNDGSKIIAEAADTIVVTSNTASSADVILSVLEQS